MTEEGLLRAIEGHEVLIGMRAIAETLERLEQILKQIAAGLGVETQ